MSSQAGVLYFDHREISESEAAAIRHVAACSDCNPPTGHSDDGAFLAHAALELDPQNPEAAQPHTAGGHTITWDGRLDNRDDLLLRLRDALRGETGDAALALAAYARWGPEGLVNLLGDWSLVIWDRAQRAVILAGDFAGVRPLYYCVQRHRVLWSTRLGPLVDWVSAEEVDEEYVGGLLLFGGCQGRTPYRGIHPVPPGHWVRVTQDRTTIQPFWEVPIGDTIRYRRESEYEDHLRQLFREAVRCRLRTTAPVVSELSGGLDSSSVVCMASHLIRNGDVKAPRLVALSYAHQGSRDTRFYHAVRDFCGLESIHVDTAAHPFLTETDTGGAQPAFWERLHSHAATLVRETGARTYFTGQLGDLTMGNWWDDSEQVSGYLCRGRIGAMFKDALSWSKVLRIPVWWVLARAFRLSLPLSVVPTGAQPETEESETPGSTEDSIARAFHARAGLADPDKFLPQTWTQARPERRKHVRGLIEMVQLRKLLPPEPLEHLYYTHPFAHRPLVTFMLSIPAEVVCRAGEPRRLMRKAFHDLWPPAVRKRRSKDAFGGVFLDSLRPLAQGFLAQPEQLRVVERGYVDLESLKKRLELLLHSLDCNEPQLRQIILLELWLRGRENRVRPAVSRLSA